MCRWTRATPGTWPSCPLSATSSSTPFWRRMMRWSSCTWMSQEVSLNRSSSLFQLFPRWRHFVLLPVCCLADTGFGTIYVSDDRGTVYSKSLERHLYTTTGGETDFINVTSLRGVFTTSILAEGARLSSCCRGNMIKFQLLNSSNENTSLWLLYDIPERRH